MTDQLSILLPYQRRWIADRAPVKVIEKSRRIGITWAEAADCALGAAVRGRAGMDAWYIGYNRDMALEFIETAALWARRFNKAARAIEEVAIDDDRGAIAAWRVRFTSGHKIVALSSRPSNLRGKDGRAVIDEAAFHEQLPELLKAALAFTMWGGMVRIISTHNGADSEFNRLVNEIRAGRRPYALHRVTLDAALADGLYKRICRVRRVSWSADGERAWREQLVAEYGAHAGEELFCTPRGDTSAFIATALVEARMRAGVPVLRLELPAEFAARSEDERRAEMQAWCESALQPVLERLDAGAAGFFGEDFGRSGDLTVIWPLQLGPNLVRRTPFVVELRNVPFRQQEQALFYIVDRLPRFIAGAMDARGNGQYLAEVAAARYGGRIRQVMLTEAWYRDNMPRYKAAFEDGTLELPRDPDILLDHRALVMDRGIARVAERAAGSDGGRRHGDSAIAAALAYFASRTETAEIAYTPALRRGERLIGQNLGPWADFESERDATAQSTASTRFGAGAW